ncbi:MAG TPA: hypothetical protein VFQ45_10605 [Longimicrobium sp.]|nr:hypothetical protein [Longimicrobium sp.]
MPEAIPEDVLRFIARYIDSAEQLDLLLLLHRDAERAWSPAAAAEAVYSVPASSERRLQALAEQGLAARGAGGAYAYAPRDPGLAETVDALAQAYRSNRAGVITTVLERQTADPVRSFADAFKLKRT